LPHTIVGPPNRLTALNERNRLANGLIFAAYPIGGERGVWADAATGQRLPSMAANTGNFYTVSVPRVGAMRVISPSITTVPYVRYFNTLESEQGLTVAAFTANGRPDIGSIASITAYCRFCTGTSTTNALDLRMNWTAANNWNYGARFKDGATTQDAIETTARQDGVPHLHLARRDGMRQRGDVFVDGVNVASVTALSNSFVGAGNFRLDGNSRAIWGPAFGWTRNLSDDEIADFSANPWQVFARSTPRTYFFPPQRPEKPPAVIIPERSRRAPLRPMELNWSHPLARHLAYAYSPALGPGLVTRSAYLSRDSARTVAAVNGSKWGRARGPFASGYGDSYAIPTSVPSPFSVFAVGVAAPAGTWQCIVGNTVNKTTGWALELNSSTLCVYKYGVGTLSGGTVSSGPGRFGVSMTPVHGSSSFNWNFLYNGAITYGGGYAAPLAVSGGMLQFGTQPYSNDEWWAGSLSLVLVFSGGLQNKELMSLDESPWQIFRRDLGRVYFYTKPMQPRRVWVREPMDVRPPPFIIKPVAAR
jgi:hypothetical protein